MNEFFRTLLATFVALIIVSIPVLLYIVLWGATGPVGFWQKAFMIIVPGGVGLIVELIAVSIAFGVFEIIREK